jgi:hypothetical protein
MNTHQLWLRQLQEKQAKRLDEGNLTEAEQNRLQQTSPKESNSKSLMEAIHEVTGQQEQPQQLDEMPAAAALVGPALKMAVSTVGRKVIAGGVRRAAVRGIGALAAGGGQEQQNNSHEPEGTMLSDELRMERILDEAMEEVSYRLIEELEESLGKRLTPDQVEEFVENNYEKILSEAKNQVTAHAVPGDLHKGVGASTPEVPTNKKVSFKTKAARFNPKKGGADY